MVRKSHNLIENTNFLVSKADLFKRSDKTDFDTVRMYHEITAPTSEHGLKDPNVQKIIHSDDLHFDLIINEEFFHESWLMFAYKFNAPAVSICEFFLFYPLYFKK